MQENSDVASECTHEQTLLPQNSGKATKSLYKLIITFRRETYFMQHLIKVRFFA